MENTILIVDFGSTFLKGLGFVPSKNGAKIFDFYKRRYLPEKPQEIAKGLRLLLSYFAKEISFKNTKLIVVFGEEMGVGDLEKVKFKRENETKPITKKEFSSLLRLIQEKSAREVENRFSREKIILAFSEIENIEIDGWETSSPINFSGSEIVLEIVNFYLSYRIFAILKKELFRAKIKNVSLVYFPKLLAKIFSQEGNLPSKVFIDIGGKSTQIFEAFYGKLQWIKKIPFGGDHFTQKIAEEFEIPLSAQDFAEEIKKKIYQGFFAPYFKKRLEAVLNKAYNEWEDLVIDNLEKESSSCEVYLLGGGSNLPLFNKLKKRLENFYSFPIIQKNLSNLSFLKGQEELGISDSQMTNLILIAQGISLGKVAISQNNFYDLF